MAPVYGSKSLQWASAPPSEVAKTKQETPSNPLKNASSLFGWPGGKDSVHSSVSGWLPCRFLLTARKDSGFWRPAAG